MNAVTVRIMIEAFAINARIESMKAANAERDRNGLALAYNEKALSDEADALSILARDLFNAWQQGLAV